MRTAIAIIALALLLLPALAQQTPDATPSAPPASETSQTSMEPGPLAGAEDLSAIGEGERNGINVGLRYSQIVDSDMPGRVETGYAYSGGFSGQFGIHANSEHHRTLLSYDGGAMFRARRSEGNEQFHNFDFSEAFDLGRWSLLLANDLSYSSQSLYGGRFPGASDVAGGGPGHVIPPLVPAQDVLIFDNPRLSDTSVAQAQYRLSRRNSITTVFSYGLLHQFEASQMDSRQLAASLGFDRKLSPLSTLALKYSFQRFSYGSAFPVMNSYSPELMYERRFTPHLSGKITLGPQVVSYATLSQNGFTRKTAVLGSGSSSLSYSTREFGMSLNYSRSVNGGSGVTSGARSDSVGGSINHSLGRDWSMAVFGGYAKTSAMTQHTKFNSRSAGAQVSRKLGRSLALDLSYTMQSQSSGSVAGFDGIRHVFGLGFSWHTEQPLR